ncbi:putative Ribosome biogenesis regulatory protein-like protein [Nannochloris sp. 'desiccata']|nr:putative Ribosome biogenesis regulatory protein-like protein [Chlorella desiccata (nom. nud.)]
MCVKREQHDGHLEYDLGNMMAYDPQPVEASTFNEGVDKACQTMATSIFQALTRQMFNLPSESAPVGRIAELPAPTTLLPREKPVPKPRPPTKWEIFAQKKGITKQKRSKLEFDDNSGEWKRRYGYKRANDESAVPIIEAGANEETGVEDPFTRMRREKKDRVKKNETQQLGNLKAAHKQGGKGVLPATLKLAATLPEHGRGIPSKRKELKGELKTAARQVATSTASLGKFDRMVDGENIKDRQLGGRKRKFISVTDSKKEKAAQGKLVDHILRKNADDIGNPLDINRAIGKFEAAAREGDGPRLKFKGANKKGKISGGGSAGKKSGGPGGGGAGRGAKGGARAERGGRGGGGRGSKGGARK